ncbi:unnamed protein product [Ambrosiozyma monospora]|uniref:Unnamed protein product n=1 Tax=Ambrosiozyma monospora TaxID=43982 RepID=A0ACB5TRW4_AMBMO|nr:unnamed protein product [Ambrosiozyma monospora]
MVDGFWFSSLKRSNYVELQNQAASPPQVTTQESKTHKTPAGDQPHIEHWNSLEQGQLASCNMPTHFTTNP